VLVAEKMDTKRSDDEDYNSLKTKEEREDYLNGLEEFEINVKKQNENKSPDKTNLMSPSSSNRSYGINLEKVEYVSK